MYNLQFDWHDDPKELLRNNYEKLFKDQNVDLVIAGHIHNYARSFPVFNETYEIQPLDLYIDPIFPVHIVTGKIKAFKNEIPDLKHQTQFQTLYKFLNNLKVKFLLAK